MDLKTAYQLYPDNNSAIMFQQLYASDSPNTSWSISYGCTYFYVPKNQIRVQLKVVNEATVTFVTIFSDNRSTIGIDFC